MIVIIKTPATSLQAPSGVNKKILEGTSDRLSLCRPGEAAGRKKGERGRVEGLSGVAG